MDEQKALSWQALYDNMWGIFALGILVPTLIYTVWGLIEIATLPQMDVSKAMEALRPAEVQQAAPAEIPATEAAPVH
ncbi:MAG: hypothetical protein AABY54_02715 [Deltaproteobacteria bacterium]